MVAGTGQVQMYLQIAQTESFEKALRAKDDYIAILDTKLGAKNWPIDRKWSDDGPEHYPEDGYWGQSIYKYKPGYDDDVPLSDLDTYLEIVYDDEEEYGDFLGVTVVGHDFPNFDWSDEELLFHVATCAWVSGFVPD